MCMLKALSKEGRMEKTTRMYVIRSKEGVSMNPKCLNAVICKGKPSVDMDGGLEDVIGVRFCAERF